VSNHFQEEQFWGKNTTKKWAKNDPLTCQQNIDTKLPTKTAYISLYTNNLEPIEQLNCTRHNIRMSCRSQFRLTMAVVWLWYGWGMAVVWLGYSWGIVARLRV